MALHMALFEGNLTSSISIHESQVWKLAHIQAPGEWSKVAIATADIHHLFSSSGLFLLIQIKQ